MMLLQQKKRKSGLPSEVPIEVDKKEDRVEQMQIDGDVEERMEVDQKVTKVEEMEVDGNADEMMEVDEDRDEPMEVNV